MPVIKRILCPVDFSDTAMVGAREAAALARAADAELLLVHVLHEPWLRPARQTSFRSPIAQQYELIARHQLARIAELLAPHTRVRTALVYGPIDEGIAQVAKNQGSDLIVMGTHAQKSFSKLLGNSTTEQVMRRARVPVVRVCPSVIKRLQGHAMPGHGTA